MPTTIRKAVSSDREAIARLHVAAWRRAYRGILPPQTLARLDQTARLRLWSGLLKQAKSDAKSISILVAQDEKQVLTGFCSASRLSPRQKGCAFEIASIYVLPRRLRRGIGSALLQSMLAEIRTRGGKKAILRTVDGTPSCDFYESRGWIRQRGKKSIMMDGRSIPIAEYIRNAD